MRQFFPEAWLWAAVDVDSSGAAQLPVTAPDTITTWELSAFGVNAAAGVGVAAQRAELTVFKDFYVELALPYQVVCARPPTLDTSSCGNGGRPGSSRAGA